MLCSQKKNFKVVFSLFLSLFFCAVMATGGGSENKRGSNKGASPEDSVSTQIVFKQTDAGLLYPLPVKEKLVFNAKNEDVYSLNVFNSFGEKMIYREGLHQHIDLDVSILTSGSYYLVLKGQLHKQSFKFIKS